MTDAGEKLERRIDKFMDDWQVPRIFTESQIMLRACVRAELERAAGIAEQLIGQSGGVATAIRKLKE